MDPAAQAPGATSIPPSTRPSQPTILYDGECAFCRHNVNLLHRLCRRRVRLETLQRRFPGLKDFDEIKLELPDGRLLGGVEALVRTLGLFPVWWLIVWIYFVPGIRQLMNVAYRVVAANRYRLAVGACPDGACGPHHDQVIVTQERTAASRVAHQPTYRRSAKLFLVLFGLLYFSAFASLYVQVPSLVGGDGLLPAADFVRRVQIANPPEEFAGWTDRWMDWVSFPTLFRLDASDRVLQGGCLLGMFLALLVALGWLRRLGLLGLGALYLSYVTAGQTFFQFQWDLLLLESTFHALLLPTYSRALWARRSPAVRAKKLRIPHGLAIFLLQWLLFRVYFESGVAKLLTPGGGWRDLSAMSAYYDTAPLPTRCGWYAHQFPFWWHQWESGLVLIIEVLLPVFIFSRPRWRAFLFLVLSLFQLAILLTANYGLFNYNTLLLGLFLLEDRHYDGLLRAWRRLRRGRHAADDAVVYSPPLMGEALRTLVLLPVALAVIAASVMEFSLRVVQSREYIAQTMSWRQSYVNLRVVNAYGLFAHMTRERLVPEIQGMSEQGEWVAYRWRWAPGDPADPPRFAAPHHPRLDFQIWFLYLSGGASRQAYFDRLLERLCTQPQAARRYFRSDPFAGSTPRKLRVLIYRYEMSDRALRESTGAWWNRTLVRPMESDLDCQIATVPSR